MVAFKSSSQLVFRVQSSGFRVQGLGFRVWGLGFRVQGPQFLRRAYLCFEGCEKTTLKPESLILASGMEELFINTDGSRFVFRVASKLSRSMGALTRSHVTIAGGGRGLQHQPVNPSSLNMYAFMGLYPYTYTWDPELNFKWLQALGIYIDGVIKRPVECYEAAGWNVLLNEAYDLELENLILLDARPEP